jgi:cyclopropane-fatty-acyl-phospholipid synthase
MLIDSKKLLEDVVSRAGITINGTNPYDIRVKNENFYDRVVQDGQLGVGESYMDGWWDCDALDQFFDRIFRTDFTGSFRDSASMVLHNLKGKLFNLQNRQRAYQVGTHHYDVGNDFYQAMLDKRLLYSCACWENASDLESAQEAKLDIICRKIDLQPGMTVLDLGCGWGSFAKFAAEKYGAHVTGVTVSKNQVELGRQLCRELPVEIRLEDYREVAGKFDRVISIGFLEHVGHKNYRCYMKNSWENLKDDGIAFIQTIGRNHSGNNGHPWITRYIFPNGMLPSIAQIGRAMEGLFVMEHWQNYGPDYDKTLMAWYERFEKNWGRFRQQYGQRFYRMWKFYLLSCAGAFRSRKTQLWQIVMRKINSGCPDCLIPR